MTGVNMKPDKEIFENHNLDKFTIELFKLEDMNESLFQNHKRYDFHQVIWFTESSGNNSFFIDFNEFTIKEDRIVVIFPGQMTKMDIQGKKGFLFAIHNDIFFSINQNINSDYLNGYFSNVFISLNNQEKRILQFLMILILQEYKGLNRVVLMESYLQSFLFHLSSFLKEDTLARNKNDLLFAHFIQLSDKYFINKREVNFYAQELSVTPKKLNELVKTMTGLTSKQFLEKRLILEIKEEIIRGKKNLKEISFDLGFSEPSYFTRFFKQQTSMSPKEFIEGLSVFLSN